MLFHHLFLISLSLCHLPLLFANERSRLQIRLWTFGKQLELFLYDYHFILITVTQEVRVGDFVTLIGLNLDS